MMVHWYAVGVVPRPPPRGGYDTVYQKVQGATPLTRAQIQALHAEVGGVPVFRTSNPPWNNPRIPADSPSTAMPLIVGAAGGLWAVFAATLPFALVSC